MLLRLSTVHLIFLLIACEAFVLTTGQFIAPPDSAIEEHFTENQHFPPVEHERSRRLNPLFFRAQAPSQQALRFVYNRYPLSSSAAVNDDDPTEKQQQIKHGVPSTAPVDAKEHQEEKSRKNSDEFWLQSVHVPRPKTEKGTSGTPRERIPRLQENDRNNFERATSVNVQSRQQTDGRTEVWPPSVNKRQFSEGPLDANKLLQHVAETQTLKHTPHPSIFHESWQQNGQQHFHGLRNNGHPLQQNHNEQHMPHRTLEESSSAGSDSPSRQRHHFRDFHQPTIVLKHKENHQQGGHQHGRQTPGPNDANPESQKSPTPPEDAFQNDHFQEQELMQGGFRNQQLAIRHERLPSLSAHHNTGQIIRDPLPLRSYVQEATTSNSPSLLGNIVHPQPRTLHNPQHSRSMATENYQILNFDQRINPGYRFSSINDDGAQNLAKIHVQENGRQPQMNHLFPSYISSPTRNGNITLQKSQRKPPDVSIHNPQQHTELHISKGTLGVSRLTPSISSFKQSTLGGNVIKVLDEDFIAPINSSPKSINNVHFHNGQHGTGDKRLHNVKAVSIMDLNSTDVFSDRMSLNDPEQSTIMSLSTLSTIPNSTAKPPRSEIPAYHTTRIPPEMLSRILPYALAYLSPFMSGAQALSALASTTTSSPLLPTPQALHSDIETFSENPWIPAPLNFPQFPFNFDPPLPSSSSNFPAQNNDLAFSTTLETVPDTSSNQMSSMSKPLAIDNQEEPINSAQLSVTLPSTSLTTTTVIPTIMVKSTPSPPPPTTTFTPPPTTSTPPPTTTSTPPPTTTILTPTTSTTSTTTTTTTTPSTTSTLATTTTPVTTIISPNESTTSTLSPQHQFIAELLAPESGELLSLLKTVFPKELKDIPVPQLMTPEEMNQHLSVASSTMASTTHFETPFSVSQHSKNTDSPTPSTATHNPYLFMFQTMQAIPPGRKEKLENHLPPHTDLAQQHVLDEAISDSSSPVIKGPLNGALLVHVLPTSGPHQDNSSPTTASSLTLLSSTTTPSTTPLITTTTTPSTTSTTTPPSTTTTTTTTPSTTTTTTTPSTTTTTTTPSTTITTTAPSMTTTTSEPTSFNPFQLTITPFFSKVPTTDSLAELGIPLGTISKEFFSPAIAKTVAAPLWDNTGAEVIEQVLRDSLINVARLKANMHSLQRLRSHFENLGLPEPARSWAWGRILHMSVEGIIKTGDLADRIRLLSAELQLARRGEYLARRMDNFGNNEQPMHRDGKK